MKTLRYEVQTRYEDSGLWGPICTVPVTIIGVEIASDVTIVIDARINAVAQAKGAKGEYSELRVVCFRGYRIKHPNGRDERIIDESVIWENGVWKDNLTAPAPVTV